jgi:bacterioferritin B
LIPDLCGLCLPSRGAPTDALKLRWFVKEQVEEVALISDLLNVVERAQDNLLQVEDYLARERPGEGGGDPTAPPLAGGGE